MGSPSSEEGRYDDEGPVHRVTISEAFAVGVYEVTRGEFGRFAAATGHKSGDSCRVWDGEWTNEEGKGWRDPGFVQTERHPVVCVSWKDVQAYVKWLSGETGEEYRLLSESEWEYVARGGTSTARYWGGTESGQCRNANGADRQTDYSWAVTCDDGYEWTAPVGSYRANGYGLYDVLGNVLEWTEDCWNESYDGAPSDGRAWESGECGRRVVRGGSWYNLTQDPPLSPPLRVARPEVATTSSVSGSRGRLDRESLNPYLRGSRGRSPLAGNLGNSVGRTRS